MNRALAIEEAILAAFEKSFWRNRNVVIIGRF